ncbi:MAG: hydroxyacid dehydrogenase [Candidatus Altiarchaeota archaeon]|nr:hydroxyacid dehydrogenase [Candidatus Altiarchaeota archaeon]
MRVKFFEVKGWEKKLLRKRLRGHELEFYREPLSKENISQAKDADVLSVFIYSNLDCSMLKKLPKLKLITTRSTGYDHIALDECRRKDITVCNVPFYGENTVAEHTFALILSLSRNLRKAYLKVLRRDYTLEGLEGFDLKGKTIGVVGAGRIGLHVIRTAKGFGMSVLAYDSNQDHFLAEVLDFKYVSLEELLKKSDIITLHVPLNKYTHHLINKDNIRTIKKGSLLVNTSRGGIVDTEALIESLDKGILAGAGIDVLEGEEYIKEEKQLLYAPEKVEVLGKLVQDNILLAKDNVVYTPHIAFYSREALERIMERTAQNILDYENKCLKDAFIVK